MSDPNDCPDPGQQGSPVLTVALTRLRSDFNEAFPYRDKGSDGWIGDSAHQDSTSGHNPDDTAGVSAEYSDSDTKPEVRAIDVDRDLKTDWVSMQDVIDRILATGNDLRRLKYIIFNEHIWSKSDGWDREPYSGSNPHDHHAHFSGDPATDEDGGQWSVALMGDEMTDPQAYKQHVMNYRIDALVHLRESVEVPDFDAPGGSTYAGFTETCELGCFIRSIADEVAQILAFVDEYQPPASTSIPVVASGPLTATLTVTGGVLDVVEAAPAEE